MIKDYCGIVAAAGSDVATILYHGLRIIQHRGQESAGIGVFKDDGERGNILVKKGKGLAHHVFHRQDIEALSSGKGIAHVRYSTTGGEDSHCYQPMKIHTSFGELAMAHNGEIVNAEELRNQLLAKGGSLRTHSDSEVILKLLAEKITSEGDVVKGIRELMKILVGSYSMALLVNDRIFAVRDPLAIRPLCIGTIGDAYCAASESVVFDSLGGTMAKDMRPGEILEINTEGFISHKGISAPSPAHCMFEWIYFARPDSYIEGRIVYDVRRKVGMRLAEENPVDADFVIPVPDSGRAHAIGYCEASGIPYAEGLIKNRYIQR
ncbi:MAG: amidophosphoribosyltransferase, partial [Thermoplasmata archaeon]|nr:amidophosphoribosyltransferase [Thermoplasmata archaeon]